MENEYINSRILKVWNKTKIEKYLPILYPEFKEGGILFIGLNPSLRKSYGNWLDNKIQGKDEIQKDIEKYKKEYGKITDKTFKRSKEGISQNDKDFLIWFESRANERDVCSYFNKFYNICDELRTEYKHKGLFYQHIDLFYFRVTNQNKAKERIVSYDKHKEFILNDFALSQLKIAKEIIKKINPKLIVVVNAFASEIIKKAFDIDESKFKKKGWDILKLANYRIPTIFSSMLTGQRALDNHSFRRLTWLIDKCIKH